MKLHERTSRSHDQFPTNVFREASPTQFISSEILIFPGHPGLSQGRPQPVPRLPMLERNALSHSSRKPSITGFPFGTSTSQRAHGGVFSDTGPLQSVSIGIGVNPLSLSFGLIAMIVVTFCSSGVDEVGRSPLDFTIVTS